MAEHRGCLEVSAQVQCHLCQQSFFLVARKLVWQCTQSQEGALQDGQANADPPEPHLQTEALTTGTRM